jgi:hypothetical protein
VNNDGTIYELTLAGALTVVHAFNGSDGSPPIALILGSDGKFYGTT